jgi:hypothetical protein
MSSKNNVSFNSEPHSKMAKPLEANWTNSRRRMVPTAHFMRPTHGSHCTRHEADPWVLLHTNEVC